MSHSFRTLRSSDLLARGGFLRDLADPGGARIGDAAAVGVQLAGNQLQEGGLAGAVAADQADPLALVNRDGGAVEERVALNPEFEVVDVQHGIDRAPAAGDSTAGGPDRKSTRLNSSHQCASRM